MRRIDRALSAFPGQAYELKSIANYGNGTEASISPGTARAAVDTATRFVDCIADFPGAGQSRGRDVVRDLST